MDPLLGIGCPNIIYPYLRSNVADAITRAGFPPIHLTEINFEAFYQQRLANMAEQAKLAAEAGNTDAAATTHTKRSHSVRKPVVRSPATVLFWAIGKSCARPSLRFR